MEKHLIALMIVGLAHMLSMYLLALRFGQTLDEHTELLRQVRTLLFFNVRFDVAQECQCESCKEIKNDQA